MAVGQQCQFDGPVHWHSASREDRAVLPVALALEHGEDAARAPAEAIPRVPGGTDALHHDLRADEAGHAGKRLQYERSGIFMRNPSPISEYGRPDLR